MNESTTKPFVIVLMGPPGSGKGTQGERLAKKLGALHLPTGDLVRELRAKAEDGDPLAIEVKKRYDNGIPQPDKIIIKAVRQKLEQIDYSKGIIFDAFPLSEEQAAGLDQIVIDYNLQEPMVLYFDVDLGEAISRITKRKFCLKDNLAFSPQDDVYQKDTCSKCGGKLIKRADDTAEVVERRYKEYEERNRLLRDRYQAKAQLVKIDAQQPIDKVEQDILAALGKV